MTDSSRCEEIRDDTLATMDIANEMVKALYENLSEVIDKQEAEIQRLTKYVKELEGSIESSCKDDSIEVSTFVSHAR